MKKLVLIITAIGSILIFPGASRSLCAESTINNKADNESEFITYEELEKMTGPVKGYGLTVFKGKLREKFEVEYDGAVPHPIFRGEKMILVRMGDPLIGSQVLAGMSGSPVYFKKNGKWKLAGAIAFGFNNPATGKSLGGITPILAMLNQKEIDFGNIPEPLKEIEERYLRLKSQNLSDPKSKNDLEKARSQMVSEIFKPVKIGLRNGSQIDLLQPTFSILTKSEPAKYSDQVKRPVPGDAVTMMLVDGDIKLGGTCTVTYVKGDKFWACGHPILMDGPVTVPARHSAIATSYKSPANAHKMVGDQYESAGYISYDGMFAIEGTLRKPPENSMLPVKIEANLNGRTLSINYKVFRHKIYSEALMEQVGSQALEPLWNPNKRATITAQSLIRYDDKSLKLFESSSAGPPISFGPFLIISNPWSAVGRTAQVTGNLLSSEWNFNVKSIEININLKEGEGTLQLDSLKILDDKDQPVDEASPGDNIQLIIALRTRQGTKNFITKIPLKIPRLKDIKKNEQFEDQFVYISVESGNRYNEKDLKKVMIGIPENKDAFVSQLMINERDPQRIFIQAVLPPTETKAPPLKVLAGDYKNSWQKVPTLNFLRSVSPAERKVMRLEIASPMPDYILNVSGTIQIRLKLPKDPVKKTDKK